MFCLRSSHSSHLQETSTSTDTLHLLRSSTHNKLIHHINLNRNSYFHRLLPTLRLWNAFPVIDINLSNTSFKAKLKKFMWNHFVDHFNDDNPVPTIFFVRAADVMISHQHQTFRHFS